MKQTAVVSAAQKICELLEVASSRVAELFIRPQAGAINWATERDHASSMGWTSSTCSATAARSVQLWTDPKVKTKVAFFLSLSHSSSDSFRATLLDSSEVALRTIKKHLSVCEVVTVKQPKIPQTYITIPCLLYYSNLIFFQLQLDTRLERPSCCRWLCLTSSLPYNFFASRLEPWPNRYEK